MKHAILRPPILAVVGILQARYQHVGAAYVDFVLSSRAENFQTGLNAEISPPLKFTKEGKITDPADLDEEFIVTLIIEDHAFIRKKGIWESERKSTFISSCFNLLKEKEKGYALLEKEDYPSMRNPSEPDLSVQFSHSHYCLDNDEAKSSSTDRLRENDKLEGIDDWKYHDWRTHKFGSETYNTGWKIRWRYLKSLIDMKTVLLLPKETVINPHAYIKNNPGIYSFTWDEDTPRLYFGIRNKKEKTAVFKPEDELSISLMYDPSEHWHKQDFKAGRLGNEYCCHARFDFGYEFFQLSATFPSRYRSWPFLLTNEFFKRSERNKEECGQPFILNLLINKEPAFIIEPYQHIRDDNVISYLPIQKSKRDTFGLGTTFLKRHSVIVNTKDGKMLYQIVDWGM